MITKINNFIGKTAQVCANNNFIKNSFEKSLSDPAKSAVALTVMSIVSKDIVGGVIYTTQSLNNKEIPEKRRRFVASLDFMNCFLMVGGQFAIFKLIEKKLIPLIKGKLLTGSYKPENQEEQSVGVFKLLKKLWPDLLFEPDTLRKQLQKLLQDNNIDNIVELVKNELKENPKTQGMEKLPDLRKQLVEILKNVNESDSREKLIILEKAIAKIPKTNNALAMWEFFISLTITTLATTALTKRVLAPLFATPLAGWMNDQWDKHDAIKAELAQKNQEYKTALKTMKVKNSIFI